MSILLLRCPTCRTCYRVPREKIPARGVKAPCRACGNTFLFRPDQGPKIWLFPDDPATSRPEVLQGLDALAGQVSLIDEVTRPGVLVSALQGGALPDLLVFGQLHALCEDELLSHLSREDGVLRLLISTHDNADIREELEELIPGFVEEILPFEPAVLAERILTILDTNRPDLAWSQL